MKYGYARVSTDSQTVKNQVSMLKNAGADKIYQEKFTGTTINRPQLDHLMNNIQKEDILIVTKLDRLARNTTEALRLVESLFNRGVKINVLNMGTIDDTPTGRLTFTIFSVFAQFERDMIVSRTQEGKAYAKENNPNFKEGRPQKYTDKQIRIAYQLRKQGLTYKAIEEQTGIGLKTLQRRFSKLVS
ncbi:recombinase family protein [Holzapfeliella sp. JNUCC 80]